MFQTFAVKLLWLSVLAPASAFKHEIEGDSVLPFQPLEMVW
jgi:hypothetical protein